MFGLDLNLSVRTWFYVGCAAVVVILLIRVLLKNRRGVASGASEAKPAQPPATVAPQAGSVTLPAVKPQPVPPPVPATVLPAPAASVTPPPAPPVAAPPPRPVAVPLPAATLDGRRIYPAALPRVEAADTPLVDLKDRTFGGLTPVFAAFLPETDARKVETRRELLTAGYYQPHAYENLQALRYVLTICGLLLAGIGLILAPARFEPYFVGALIGLPLLGWAMPRLWIRGKAADRRTQIEKAMPDMLDMLNMCVSQGMTVPIAMKRVGDELPAVHPALHQEFQIVTEQARIGTMDHALQNFRSRIDVPEVHSFCNLMLQTERMGTSVSQSLQEYSDNMRASLQQRADERGNRAAFKLLFPTVLCLMPAIYMFLLGPAVISLNRYYTNRENNGQVRQARDIISSRAAPGQNP